jgi:hypothetical protein
MLSEAQPLLRLALPQGGAPSAALTERPDAEIDLETGLVHVETMGLADFQLVHEALFGASLTLLRGEIRVGTAGGEPEDIPLELRLDRTAGEPLVVAVEQAPGGELDAIITNVIESAVRVGALAAASILKDGRRVPLALDGVDDGTVLPPGGKAQARLRPLAAFAPDELDEVVVDQSGIVTEPDRAAIWSLAFDRSAGAQLARAVSVEAVRALFAPDASGDSVAAFVVTIENGGSVRVTEDELRSQTTARVPVEPLLTGGPMPPIRYRTETLWVSGGIGVSPWRETDATILLPVKTKPGTG